MDDLLTVTVEVMPEIAAAFEEQYVEVKLAPRVIGGKQMLVCDRCRSYVHNDSYQEGPEQHRTWHRNVSLAIWMLQGWALAVMKEKDSDRDDQA